MGSREFTIFIAIQAYKTIKISKKSRRVVDGCESSKMYTGKI